MSPPTRRRRASIAITVATVAILALAPPAGAAAKRKPLKCKRGQIVLKVNKSPVCRAVKGVFPAAKTGDELRIGFETALGFEPARVRGRQVRSMSSILGRQRARSVRRKLQQALPRLLAHRPKTARAAAAGDCVADYPDFQENLNGGSIGVRNGQGQMSADAGGRKRVTISFPVGECNRFKAPACPTPDGVVDGRDERGREYHIVVWDGDELVLNQLMRDTAKTTLHGQVRADAKLEFLQIDDVLTHVVRIGGSKPGLTYTEDGTITRGTRVDMRSGVQTPKDPVINLVARVNGQSPGTTYQVDGGYLLLVRSAADWAALVDREIGRYRTLEQGWNEAGACAHIDFSPASGTLHLHKSGHGRASGTIRANAGGAATDGVTTVTAQTGGTVTPASANGGSPGFDYTVTATGPAMLTLAVRATSTAGVATGSWSQPIDKDDWPVKQISGTFSGQDHNGMMTTTFNGSVTFIRAPNLDQGNTLRALAVSSGSFTSTVTGSVLDCTVTGSHTFTIKPSPTVSNFKVFNPAADVVFGAGKPDWGLPWDYFWATGLTTDFFGTGILSSCADPQDYGSELQFGPGHPGSSFPGTTPDGRRFTGSATYDDQTFSEAWDFTGTE